MMILAITGSLCFVAALLLPSCKNTGFLSLSGPGWKVFALTMVLIAMGIAGSVKGTYGRGQWRAVLPGALNLCMVALMLLGLCSVRGTLMHALGIVTLAGCGPLLVLLIAKGRGEAQIGAYLWGISGVLLALNGLWS